MEDTIVFENSTDDRDTAERTPDDVIGGDIIWDIVDSVTDDRDTAERTPDDVVGGDIIWDIVDSVTGTTAGSHADAAADITDGQLNATSDFIFCSDVAQWEV